MDKDDMMTADEQDELLYQMYSAARKLGSPEFATRMILHANTYGFNAKPTDLQAWSERFEEDEANSRA